MTRTVAKHTGHYKRLKRDDKIIAAIVEMRSRPKPLPFSIIARVMGMTRGQAIGWYWRRDMLNKPREEWKKKEAASSGFSKDLYDYLLAEGPVRRKFIIAEFVHVNEHTVGQTLLRLKKAGKLKSVDGVYDVVIDDADE